MSAHMHGAHDESTSALLARRMWLSSVSLAAVLTVGILLTSIVFGSAVSATALILGATLVGSVLSWANVERFDRPALERSR